jgi:hypothetical protein
MWKVLVWAAIWMALVLYMHPLLHTFARVSRSFRADFHCCFPAFAFVFCVFRAQVFTIVCNSQTFLSIVYTSFIRISDCDFCAVDKIWLWMGLGWILGQVRNEGCEREVGTGCALTPGFGSRAFFRLCDRRKRRRRCGCDRYPARTENGVTAGKRWSRRSRFSFLLVVWTRTEDAVEERRCDALCPHVPAQGIGGVR